MGTTASEHTIAPNLVRRANTIYGLAKIDGRRFRAMSPWQGSAGLNRNGNPTPALLRWRDEWLGNLRARAEKVRNGEAESMSAAVPSLARLIEAYREMAARQFAAQGAPSPSSSEHCISLCRKLFADMGLSERSPVSEATVDRVERYIADVVARKSSPEEGRYSAARVIGQARCLWAQWTRAGYERRHILIPACLDRWPKPRGVAPRYRDPGPDLKRRTADLVTGLLQSDPPAGRLGMLCLCFGMRASDARRAEWDWFVKLPDGRVVLEYVPHKTATSTGGRVVAQLVDESVWSALSAARDDSTGRFVVRADGAAEDRGLAATNQDRRIDEERRLAAALRGIGHVGRKPLHDLRKMFSSATYEALGLARAAQYAGDDPATLSRYYLAASRPTESINVLAALGSSDRRIV